jgi:hypothetical protein
MMTKKLLAEEMVDSIGELPDRWKQHYDEAARKGDDKGSTLEEWLLEVYSDHVSDDDYTQDELKSLRRVLRSLMRFEPAERAAAVDVLQDEWFKDLSDSR